MVSRDSGMMEGPRLPTVKVVMNEAPSSTTVVISPVSGSGRWLTWSGIVLLQGDDQHGFLYYFTCSELYT